MTTDYIDVIFDGPPSHESGRFVEVEDASGKSISYGEWVQRPDGYWALRMPRAKEPSAPEAYGEKMLPVAPGPRLNP